MSRQRLTGGQWRDLLAQYPRSGMGVSAFCRQHDIGVSTFFAWRRRLAEEPQRTFIELTAQAQAPGAATIEVLLPRGMTVRVHDGFDPDMLRHVVEALS